MSDKPTPLRIELASGPLQRGLTDGECAKLIGGTVGSLLNVAHTGDIKRALLWWAENINAIDVMAGQMPEMQELGNAAAAKILADRDD